MTQRINISLPKDLARELRRTIPERSRSKYIAEVLREKLIRRKNLKKDFIKSLKAQAKLTKEIQEDFKHVDAEELARLP